MRTTTAPMPLSPQSTTTGQNPTTTLENNLSTALESGVLRTREIAAYIFKASENPDAWESLALCTERVNSCSPESLEPESLRQLKVLFDITHPVTGRHLQPLLPQRDALCRQMPVLATTSFEKYFRDLAVVNGCGDLTQTAAKAIVELLNAIGDSSRGNNQLANILENRISEYIVYAFSASEPLKGFSDNLQLFSAAIRWPVRLSVALSSITDNQLACLATMPIRELNLTSCRSLTSAALLPFQHLQALTALDISCNPWVDNSVLETLPLSAERLKLSVCLNFDVTALRILSRHPSLNYVNVFGCRQLPAEEYGSLKVDWNEP